MAKASTISAQMRERAGKGAARATRRAGRVPAVIYGNKMDPVSISLDPLELQQNMGQSGFFARVFEVKVGKEKHRVLARDVQFDPVTDRPLHVDFMRFSAGATLNVDVAVAFENEEASPGIKRGGVLNVVMHTIELTCAADNIPHSIPVDLSGLDIGDTLHLSDITLPADVQPVISDRDFTIATIAAPTLMKEDEEEAAEAEEEVEEEATEAPGEAGS